MKLPVRPLIDVVQARGGIGAVTSGLPDTDRARFRRAYYRAVSCGHISEPAADEFTVRLFGMPPVLLWPEETGPQMTGSG